MQLWDGYQWRQERREDMTAYFVAQLMNISGKSLKRRITGKELLKPIRTKVKTRNKKDDEEYLKTRFQQRLKGGGANGNNS